MRTSAAALELDFTEPSITAAKAICAVLRHGDGMDRPGLLRAMESSYGSTAADGHWSLRDAYDVLELAQVLHLAKLDLPQEPAECLAALTALTASLPTHTVRSEEQIALQQFSTPAAIAYLAALAVRITTADTVLEPSAGTGLLAVFAARAGAKLVLNEIDPARASMLQAAFPTAPVSRYDGELIDDLLPLSIRPSAVLINPPFSRSIGRHADPLAAFRHLRAALKRLDAGGRCAAILPDRVDTSSRAWAKATDGCAITLHVELPANAYAKHGTSQIVKLIVLEKGVQDDVAIVRCNSLAEVLATITAENQSRRNHYLLEPGWRADAAIQGLGRTHRTHQATAPLFRPVSTDCRGERRFISTIARRLDSLGALTRGQRQTGGQGLFDPRDNLESDYAKESLETWFRLLADGKLRSTTLGEFQMLTGLELEGEGGGLKEELPPIQRWLNRILALRIALQNAIFDEYLGLIEARIEAAREAGTLDLGVESINAERITILDRTVIRRDQTSGAETEILRLETEERYKPLSLDRALRLLGDDARPIVNRKSGRAAIRCSTYSLTDDDAVASLRTTVQGGKSADGQLWSLCLAGTCRGDRARFLHRFLGS